MEYLLKDSERQKLKVVCDRLKILFEKYSVLSSNKELDFDALYDSIKTGYITGVYGGLEAQFLAAVGADKLLGCNYWEYYYDMFCAHFNLENYNSFLGIGGGFYDAFSVIVSKNNPNATVTSMDPSIKDFLHQGTAIKTVAKDFSFGNGLFDSRGTNIDEYNLLYGIHPCGASIPMIKSAGQNEKEMFLALCDCNGLDGFFGGTYEDWVDYVLDTVNRSLPRGMYMEHFYDYGYRTKPLIDGVKDKVEIARPVIYTHKKRVLYQKSGCISK